MLKIANLDACKFYLYDRKMKDCELRRRNNSNSVECQLLDYEVCNVQINTDMKLMK